MDIRDTVTYSAIKFTEGDYFLVKHAYVRGDLIIGAVNTLKGGISLDRRGIAEQYVTRGIYEHILHMVLTDDIDGTIERLIAEAFVEGSCGGADIVQGTKYAKYIMEGLK